MDTKNENEDIIMHLDENDNLVAETEDANTTLAKEVVNMSDIRTDIYDL